MRKLLLPCLALASLATGCFSGLPLPPTFHDSDGAPNYQAMGVLGRSAPMAPLFQNIYRNATGPLSWQSGTYSDLEKMGQVVETRPVRGEACQWSLNLPLFAPLFINLDSSAYQAAYLQALRNGQVDAVVDVRADRSVMGVLFIYWKVCTVVNATGVKFAEGNPMKPGAIRAER